MSLSSNLLHRPWRHSSERADRRNIHLSVDAELLSAAQALDIDLAQALEEELRRKLQEHNTKHFAEDAPQTGTW